MTKELRDHETQPAPPSAPAWNDLPLPPDANAAEIAALKARVADLEKRMQQMELRAWNTSVGRAGF